MDSVSSLWRAVSGPGDPADAVRSGAQLQSISGVGIRGMVERMNRLGGTLEISSGDLGTTVVATLPDV